ncbi:hypothetical protein AB0I28_36575 [Phytomonospora sp. NPDC050363]|uniref:hypothetical protein n=1 Tax=Phytomonospora sp. NPDC050363 TaxID=3155642 RepID=UPI00340F5A5B
MAATGPLGGWHEQLFFVLMVLEDMELRDTGFPFDYSRESLAELEKHLVGALGDAGQLSLTRHRALVEGTVAYLGEALMRVAGGAWAWSETPVEGFPGGAPIVTADPALGLEPVTPVLLLRRAFEVRDAARFTEAHDRLLGAVEEKKRADPSWRPAKEPTDADQPDPDSAPLARWLADRAAAFGDWTAAYSPDGNWDFSPDSLTRLQELVRRETPTKEELKDPANRVFRDGAAWYLGEVLRRNVGGRWNLNPDLGGDDQPYLEALGPARHKSLPVVALRISLRRDGYLRQHLDDLTR